MSPEGSAVDDADSLARFERGDAIEVAVGRIESELAALWRRADRAEPPAGGNAHAITRACLWNLVIRVSGEAEFRAVKQLVDDVAQRVPTRTIVMRSDASGDSGVRAWVEANWRRSDARRPASGSDEITIAASGGAVTRLPSLVRALLMPDAPTAMFWPHALPSDARDLVHEAERLIVDTRQLPDERGLVELWTLLRQDRSLEVADLAWLGVAPLRDLAASLFDPPRDPSVLQRLDRARVTSNVAGTQARGLLALGWLGACLGWTSVERAPGSTPALRRWLARRRDGATVVLELAAKSGGPSHGVAGLELEAGTEVWSLERTDSITVRAPELPLRCQPARSHGDAELVTAALGGRGRDPVYRDALARAVALVQA